MKNLQDIRQVLTGHLNPWIPRCAMILSRPTGGQPIHPVDGNDENAMIAAGGGSRSHS
ncbi:hypothetical protein GCM10010517_43230 [Streptosporangium fragile]|uniref:Uncharacterized protein n=1 Tax=Streptosporangium fragile TaxID=46186 RepID=A0ABN3VZZ2_9ACTN